MAATCMMLSLPLQHTQQPCYVLNPNDSNQTNTCTHAQHYIQYQRTVSTLGFGGGETSCSCPVPSLLK